MITYVLVIAVIARQSSPLLGAVLSGGRLNVVFALLSSASRPAPGGGKAARPRGCVCLPPRSAKPPCPSRGLACRCVPPRQLGRAVGLKAYLSYAVSAKPSALFVLSGCPPPPGEDSPCPTGEDSPCPTGEDSPCPTEEDSPCPTGEDSTCPTGEDSTCPTGEDSPCPTGGIPPNPLTSYYDDDFHILAEGNHHHNMRAKINTPILSTKWEKIKTNWHKMYIQR